MQADLASGKGLYDAVQALHPLDAVINCAAISQPAVCERDVGYAEAVNVPTTLLDALVRSKAETGNEPLLIHISTDQVYDGSKAHWREEGPCEPVNGYGRTKLAGEHVIQVVGTYTMHQSP
jgi:dTDP-4-dehydrorhamnose reductase